MAPKAKAKAVQPKEARKRFMRTVRARLDWASAALGSLLDVDYIPLLEEECNWLAYLTKNRERGTEPQLTEAELNARRQKVILEIEDSLAGRAEEWYARWSEAREQARLDRGATAAAALSNVADTATGVAVTATPAGEQELAESVQKALWETPIMS